MGTTQTINRVEINWEIAYASRYTIDMSTDGINYTTVYIAQKGKGGIENIRFNNVEARYVRMIGIERATDYGYSI